MIENYIKKLYIRGYKKFKDFCIDFKPGLNILIGENSVGKSTILEAINIVLNQYYFTGDIAGFQQKLNIQEIQSFFKIVSPQLKDLPSIEIEIELSLDKVPEKQPFCGTNYDLIPSKEGTELKSGIKFKFSFDEAFETEFDNFDFSNTEDEVIPVEYYHAVWTTFAGQPYKRFMNPLKSILIDSSISTKDIYGNYARTLYRSGINEKDQRKLSYDFSNCINSIMSRRKDLLQIGENQFFNIDEQKSKFSNLIEIRENDISLRNMGKGEENILKTSLSLEKKSNLDLVMLEEPENHLSYSNTRKQIAKIQEKKENVHQIIATTHESMILNELDLMSAIWIKENEGQSLDKLPEKDAQYFKKADNFDILRYVLGNKIILVEGASEFILLPSIINYCLGIDLDKSRINILSMRGIYYKHFLKLSDIVDKKTLVLTDNDGLQERVDDTKKLNNNVLQINMPENTEEFTFEVTVYNENKDLCTEIINEIAPGKLRNTRYKEHENLSKILAAMLSRKTEFALKLSSRIKSGEKFNVPKYIKEGVKWLAL